MRLFVLMTTALLSAPALAEEATDCLLEVEGRTYFAGPCNIDVDGDTTVVSGPDTTYLVYLDTSGDISSWNEEAGAGHAHTQLGVLSQDGSCWSNETAKVCYSTAAPTPQVKSDGMTEQTKR